MVPPSGPVESVEAVLTDLRQFLVRSVLAHGMAGAGIRQMASMFATSPRTADNPDPALLIGAGDPNEAEARVWGDLRMSEVMRLAEENGPFAILIGQQWVVFTFSAWEHEFRPRVARAHYVDQDDLTYSLLGDLRHIRNDVVHSHGIATAGHSGRCELLGHWIQVGEEIMITGVHITEFMDRFPWADMTAGP